MACATPHEEISSLKHKANATHPRPRCLPGRRTVSWVHAVLTAFPLLLCCAAPLRAQTTNTYTGASAGAWSAAANWSQGSVPAGQPGQEAFLDQILLSARSPEIAACLRPTPKMVAYHKIGFVRPVPITQRRGLTSSIVPETPLTPCTDPALPIRIDGRTRLYGIVGDPIFQVRTPGGITAKFAELGANAIVVPMHVKLDDFDSFMTAIRGLQNLEGLVVTIPHKMPVVKHLEQMTDRVMFLGAANVIRRITPGGGWTGDVTDGQGMMNALHASGFDPCGRRALLVGAGGAGSAIALSLIEKGVSELAIHDADSPRRDGLVARLRERGAKVRVGSPDPGGYDLAINATPTGAKAGDPLPIDAQRLSPETFVADVITEPVRTRLLEVAAARGCRTQVGRSMFAGQVDLVADYLLAAPHE